VLPWTDEDRQREVGGAGADGRGGGARFALDGDRPAVLLHDLVHQAEELFKIAFWTLFFRRDEVARERV